MKLTVSLGYDPDTESPCEYDGQWKLYSFNSRHINFKHPDNFIKSVNEFGEIVPVNIGLARKLAVGTAFFLSYFEHGNCVWSLKGHGPQCRWDTTQIAGILVWEHSPDDMGAKSYKDREKDAEAFLQEYTNWCNGQCFCYCIRDEKGEAIDFCGGYIGHDYLLECMKSEHPQLFDKNNEVVVTGDAAWIME